jgi:hypothetical protein
METCASVGLHVFHDGNEAFDAEFYRDGLFIACNEHSDPSSEGVLQLFMTDEDLGYELTWEELAKMNIDNLATQTPEEKEAIDLIDTTPHQYEMSKFKSNPVIQLSIDEIDKFSGNEWNGEGLPPVGVECDFFGVEDTCNGKVEIYHIDDNKVMFLGRIEGYPSESTINNFKEGRDLMAFYVREGDRAFRKPETPQQREEREREELADTACENMFGESIQNCRPDVAATVRCMIDAGYRKESNQ